MRHPYMTNALRLSSAQTMHDRATDDRTDFSDWYGSGHYAIWKSDMVADLLAGKSCFAYDRGALVDTVQDLHNRQWGQLSDAQKEALNAHSEYCDAVVMTEIMRRAEVAGWKNQRALSHILADVMHTAFLALAAEMAESKAQDYYDEELSK